MAAMRRGVRERNGCDELKRSPLSAGWRLEGPVCMSRSVSSSSSDWSWCWARGWRWWVGRVLFGGNEGMRGGGVAVVRVRRVEGGGMVGSSAVQPCLLAARGVPRGLKRRADDDETDDDEAGGAGWAEWSACSGGVLEVCDAGGAVCSSARRGGAELSPIAPRPRPRRLALAAGFPARRDLALALVAAYCGPGSARELAQPGTSGTRPVQWLALAVSRLVALAQPLDLARPALQKSRKRFEIC